MATSILADSQTMCADCRHNPALGHFDLREGLAGIQEHLRACVQCHAAIRAKGSAATREDAIGYEKLA